jgi:thiamine biosynthesis lipoprotein
MRCDKAAALAILTTLFLSAAASSQNPSEVLVYGRKYVMGTVFEIAAYDQSSQHASAAIAKALDQVVRIDALLSNYKPESPLSQLNRSAHFQPHTVPPDLYRVIEDSMLYSSLTDGKFDISVAPWVDMWKAALSGGTFPSLEQQNRVRDCIGYEKIELTPPDQITFHSPCLRLDLGAIGKGYAVDRAAEVLRNWGIHDALINAGGSTLLAMGAPPGKSAWLLHLRDPSDKLDPQVMLKDQSVSTSEQTPPSLLGKDSAGHIIDPGTGKPLQTDFAVSVITKTATASDALSTSLLLVGPEKGRALASHFENVSAVWISPLAKTEIISGGPQVQFGREKPAAEHGNIP